MDARYPSLAGRTVVVTGGASGIGACLVERFVAQRSRVGFIDIDAAAGRALAARLAQLSPGRCEDSCLPPRGADAVLRGRGPTVPPLFVEADLTDVAALERAVGEIRAHFGPVTVLLNNAANDRREGMDAVTPDVWDAGIAVNLRHQFFAARCVAAEMKEARSGSIVNFGSVGWMLRQGGMPVYAAAKAAVQGLTRSLARDLGPYGIRVNTLVPGWVMTVKQLSQHVDAAARAEIARGQSLEGPLLPGHIAAMALFLAADDSAMCTGQDFIVDGGWA